MPDSEEIRWVKSTANELNNLLQVISESSQVLENLFEPTPESDKYFAMLQSAIERATKVTRLMVDRVGGYAADTAITLPEPATVEESPGSIPADVRIHNPKGPLELVMIVDDEDFVTMLAQRVLAEQGYRVITAKDGFQALDIFKKLHQDISLVILDFTMPVMDGADVFHELLQLDPNVAVVLSSGFAEQDRLRGMLARGLRGFIPKPYAQQKLIGQVRTTLDAIKAERNAGNRP
jgi:CheY-like chemotaxis protein